MVIQSRIEMILLATRIILCFRKFRRKRLRQDTLQE